SQKDVITAIVDDENTINAIIAKLDKSTSLVFLGFLTDLYNRLLLTRKGAVDIDQKFIDENLLTLKAYSKAYAKLAEALKTMESTTPTNAYIFCKNYNKISKFSIVDRFIKDKRLFRTTLINSLEGKYQNQMSILTNFESLRNLKTMFSSIGKAKSWTEINQLKKIKSQIVNLVINNRENHLVFNGILISEELLERKFFDILEINWQVQPNENWLDHAKWFTRNFSLNSSHKNIIAEKIKTLINK
ncbi:MAG: hypothetical protein KAR20_20090, partial [Candidatus Heimdallarchaeota archaeon]|nr:hypothetical protein [Candidatus Heimdallarchaeota archaeon]